MIIKSFIKLIGKTNLFKSWTKIMLFKIYIRIKENSNSFKNKEEDFLISEDKNYLNYYRKKKMIIKGKLLKCKKPQIK